MKNGRSKNCILILVFIGEHERDCSLSVVNDEPIASCSRSLEGGSCVPVIKSGKLSCISSLSVFFLVKWIIYVILSICRRVFFAGIW